MVALLALALVTSGCRMLDENGATLCPARLPPVRGVVVEQTGRERWHEPGVDCGDFRPTSRDLRRYLARAERTDPGSLHHALPESPCIATGRVGLGAGRRGRFRIDRFGNMRLTIGRGFPILLYCADCRFGGFER